MIVNIIGAGIAGSITATLLRRNGIECRVIDDGDKFSASQASSNLYIASWLKKFQSAESANGIRIVEELYGASIDKPFSGGVAAAMKVKHIAQKHLLVKPDVVGMVAAVTPGRVDVIMPVLKETAAFFGPTIVCAGYRQAELLKWANLPEVTVKVGHCFLFKGQLGEGKSRLAIVSPYRHEKLYQFDEDTIYYADSVALAMESYKAKGQAATETTLARARKHLGNELPLKEFRVGYRPFVDGHDFGYAHRIAPSLWAINGGGKNGMVAYANCASKVLQELKEN